MKPSYAADKPVTWPAIGCLCLVAGLLLLVLLYVSGCSRAQCSAPQQTDDRTGVSQYCSEFPPPYHFWAIEQSRKAGR